MKNYTERGFRIDEFRDLYGSECSIQKSSLATKDALWLGVAKPEHHHVTGECMPRMHIDKKLARFLIKKLTKFVVTGDI